MEVASVQQIDEKAIKGMMFEVLHLEHKNLRSKAMTDQKMSEELRKIIVEYSKLHQ